MEKYNDIMITKLFFDLIIYLVDIHSNSFEVEEFDTWVNNPHFNLLKKVAINAKVMLTKNINIDKNMVNGALVVVVNIGFDIHHKMEVVAIMLNHSELQLKVKICTIKFNYTSKGKFYKSTFPLALAYAMTSHKSQGATISSKILVDIQNAFAPQLTYVMLFKVTK
jgi:ATP-dependent DNA helicase PIF1